MTPYALPRKDDLGFCNLLISALGGDGANMAGKLLFKLGCEEFGLDGGYDAKYGSEKKGTPTDVSVRFCDAGTPVRQSGPTKAPHFLAVFHADLIGPLQLGRGLHDNAVCVVNTVRPPEAIRDSLQLVSGRIVCVDATRIAFESRSRLNMPLLGALCRELGFPVDRVKQIVTKQWPKAASANLQAFDRALAEAHTTNFEPQRTEDAKRDLATPDDITVKLDTGSGLIKKVRPRNGAGRGPLGWLNMLNGGTIDALTHSTFGRDNRVAGRGRIPHFEPGACHSCGICLTVCSDPGGLLWREGRMVGIDDRFCKGCMRCVEVCPETKKGKALTFASGGES